MQIRLAKQEDIGRLLELMGDLNIQRTDLQKQGFVEYPIPSESELKRRIEGNGFFYVREDEDRVIGFSAAYTRDRLGQGFSDNEIAQHILTKRPPLVYWDQLAIEAAHQNKTNGTKLAERFIRDVPYGYGYIWGAASHEPIRNTTMIKILCNWGFSLKDEIETKQGLRFGIYRHGTY